MPEGGLALDADVGLVVVDVEHRLGGVADAPDDDGGDLDRVAALVVHLEFLAVEVAGAQGDLLLLVERVGEEEPAGPHAAAVAAEEDEDGRLVGLEGEEAARADDGDDQNEDRAHDQHGAAGAHPHEEDHEGEEIEAKDNRKHQPAAGRLDGTFATGRMRGGGRGVHGWMR